MQRTLTPNQREAYEERAAILEYDAGMSRKEAERKALEMVKQESWLIRSPNENKRS